MVLLGVSGWLTCFDLKWKIKLSKSIFPQWKVLQFHRTCTATARHITQLVLGEPGPGPTRVYSGLLCLKGFLLGDGTCHKVCFSRFQQM